MITFFGESSNYLLFVDDANGVVIDKTMNMVEEIGPAPVVASMRPWLRDTDKPEQALFDLASGALADLRVQTLTASGRLYTIPKAAQEEAIKALAWRKEHDRGGTPVGLHTARILANGGQIGLRKVRHIAKYFPRHEVDKKAKGYKPGQDGFPSNGRIAWALWGGDSAWRWARAIVDSENKKALNAAGDYYDIDDYALATEYTADVDYFKTVHALRDSDDDIGPQFVGRTLLDGSGIDRLYAIDGEGNALVWDEGAWDDLGQPNSDISVYDKLLDGDDIDSNKQHVFIDPASALIVSARLQQNPYKPVSVYDLDADEAALIDAAMSEIDWYEVDSALTAAGEDIAVSDGDGKYTPEERSAKARQQVRDQTGRFSAMGSRVVIGGNAANSGTITKINPLKQSVSVKLDSGSVVEVPANQTQTAENFAGSPDPGAIQQTTPLDTGGILGKPRIPIDTPKATMAGTLPPLTPDELQSMLYDYPAWVKQQRDSAAASSPATSGPTLRDVNKEMKDYDKKREKETGVSFKSMGDLREHPITRDIFKKKKSYGLYYNPMLSSAEQPNIVEIENNKKTIKELVNETPEGTGKPLDPTTSDVQPIYLAIVSPEDPRAVFDLISIVPAGTNSTSPVAYKRDDKKWVRDDQTMSDLSSVTPPPVIPLHGEMLKNVFEQIDGVVTASGISEFAQGGLDRNRGNAEKLRRYWLYGRGAAKIRWNTPGDWTRCYRQLMKYMGPRAKGYCQLRHKEATGVWTGSKFNVGKRNIRGSAELFGTHEIATEEQFIDALVLRAKMNDARNRVLTAGANMEGTGCKFRIPIVIPEGAESGDGRMFDKKAIEIRELPLPLLWQIKTGDGHMGSVVVGRIDHMERTPDGIGNAHGVFDTGVYGREAERLVRNGFLRGVSADLDQFEAVGEADNKKDNESGADKEENKIGGDKIKITHARVMAVTIVPKPAFEQCTIAIEDDGAQMFQEDTMEIIPDGVYIEDLDELDAQAIVACGILAGAIPAVPPAHWFGNPNLSGPTPLTVDDAGRVFGHIAAWSVSHIGMAPGTRPPKSKSKYAYFHTGLVRTDDGKDVPVGQLTLAGGHASLEASAMDAARHYDDTGSAIADVHAGEDSHGIWVAGALRPSASPEQIRALRASAPSGDWRPISGSLELVAVCQVNVPGFPIARARVASGQVYALVAAGASTLARMKSDPLGELSGRIAALENKEKEELIAKAEELSARFRSELSYDPTSLGYMSKNLRKKLASEGKALPDGSYPIRDVAELKAAISGYGRSKESKRAQVRRHIMKKARGLDRADLIPEAWKSASVLEEDAAELRARVASAQSVAEYAQISPKVRQRLASEGKALPDGSFPIRNMADLSNAINAYERSEDEDRSKVKNHIMKRAHALGNADAIPAQWKSASSVEQDVTALRARIASASSSITNEEDSK
jgi:hypothetical protein